MTKTEPDDDRILSPHPGLSESEVEQSLRPRDFSEFVGQPRITQNLAIYIEAARQRGDALDHVLFTGLPGLGKTTLSTIISREMETNLKFTAGPILERPADLAGQLTNLRHGDCLFIDEIHRVPASVQEYLHTAMEDYSIDIVYDSGPSARSVRLKLERFTLIGATTREGLLKAPFRNRFPIVEKLEPYGHQDLTSIVNRSARILEAPVAESAAEMIASRSRGTPRIANRIIRRLRDVAQIQGDGFLDESIAQTGFEMLGIDDRGCDATDRRILEALLQHEGGPLGLKTVAVMVGESPDTIEEVHEPYLIQCGFLKRTPQGRMATDRARSHLGHPSNPQTGLFQP